MAFLLLVFLFIIPSTGHCDIIGPDGFLKDHHGSIIFKSYSIDVEKFPDYTLITIRTNYRYDDFDVSYNIADVYIGTLKGSIAIKMAPYKVKGNILLNPDWETADDTFSSIYENCKKSDGNPIFVHAKGGTLIGKAEIAEITEDKIKTIFIKIPNEYIEYRTITSIEWGTAQCGNSWISLDFPILAGRTTPEDFPQITYPFPNYSHPATSIYQPNENYGGFSWGNGGYGGYWDDFLYDDDIIYIDDDHKHPVVPITSSLILFLTGCLIIGVKKWKS